MTLGVSEDLKMEAARSSETTVSSHVTTWCHKQQDHDLDINTHLYGIRTRVFQRSLDLRPCDY
jgi:hypothetical protein